MCTATWTQHVPRCKPRGRTRRLAPSAVPDVLAPGLRCVFCGINPGRVSDAAAAHFANPRNDFWRLLHDAGLHAAPARPAGAVRAARARLRRHERRVPHDARARATCAAATSTPGALERHRARARAARDRVRRQGGLPRRSSASAPELGPQLRTLGSTGAVRAAVDVAGERGRPVRRAARAGFARCASGSSRSSAQAVRGARRRRRTERVLLVRFRAPGDRRRLVGDARRRHRPGRERRAGARGASCARRSGCTSSSSARSSASASALPVGRGSSTASASASTSSASSAHEPAPTIDLAAEGVDRGALVDARRARGRRPSAARPAPSSPSSCVVWRRDRGPRRESHLLAAGIWFGGSTALVFVGVPAIRDARGRAARARDEGARPALAAARLRRAASSRRSPASRSPRATGEHRTAFQVVLWMKVVLFRLPARRLVPAQLRARPAPAGGDPRRPRAAHAQRALVVVGWLSYALTMALPILGVVLARLVD